MLAQALTKTLCLCFTHMWQQLGKGSFLFQHFNAPMYKARSKSHVGEEALNCYAYSHDLTQNNTNGYITVITKGV